MSSFSPTHWVIVAVIIAAVLYGLFHAVKAVFRFSDWRRERAERQRPDR